MITSAEGLVLRFLVVALVDELIIFIGKSRLFHFINCLSLLFICGFGGSYLLVGEMGIRTDELSQLFST